MKYTIESEGQKTNYAPLLRKILPVCVKKANYNTGVEKYTNGILYY